VRSSDISDFVLGYAQTVCYHRAQLVTTACRSCFRFLFQNGELQADLAPFAPAAADWRLSTVPKYLTPRAGQTLPSNLMASTGGPARSSFAARVCCTTGCRCLWIGELNFDLPGNTMRLHANAVIVAGNRLAFDDGLAGRG